MPPSGSLTKKTPMYPKSLWVWHLGVSGPTWGGTIRMSDVEKGVG